MATRTTGVRGTLGAWVVVGATAALAAGTVVGFILADTVGIFGFTLRVVTGWAYEALVSELLSAVLLLVLVLRSWRAAARDAAWAAQKVERGMAGGVSSSEFRRRQVQVAAMPTMGALRCRPPIDP